MQFCHTRSILLVGVGGCVLYRLQHTHRITIIPHKYMYDHSELDGIAHRDTTNPQHFHLSAVGRDCSLWITAHRI